MEKIKTLRRAFYMIILPFNASVIFLFFFLIQWLELKETYSGLREKLIITLQQENAKLAYPLWVLDYERLEELSIALLNDSDIRGINIYGDDDSPIVTMGTTKGYMRETMDFLSYRENAKDEALSGLPVFFLEALAIYDSREKSFSRGSPILYQSGKEEIPVGSVYLTISDRNIRGSFIRQLRLFIIFFLAIFTLISLSVSFAYYWTVQLPLREIRSFIREKEKLGSIIKDHPEEDRSNDLSYIRKRFERLWNRQDDLLQELHNSKEYYRNLLNSLPMGVVLIDREDLILESNFAFQVLTGYSEREIRRMTMEDFTPEPYQASDKKNLEVLKATGLFKPYEKRIKTRKGREIPVRLNGSSISRGDEYRIIISFEDISEKVDIESELKRSYNFLDTAAQIARVGGWELNLVERKLNWTREVYNIYRLEESYIPDMESTYQFFSQKYRNIIKTAMERAVNSGIPFEIEAELANDSGSETWVIIKGQPRFEGEAIVAVHGTLQDITDRKNSEKEYHDLQKELSHKSRLDLIGQLASGVAHDFNNILGGIISSAEILKFRLKDTPEDFSRYIEIIISQAENAAMLSSKLLALSRKENYNKGSVSLNGLLKDTVSLLKNTLDRKINITLKMSEDSSSYIDYSSIQNAIMNICINSSHAMPDGGDLLITKETDSNTEGETFNKIIISDTGTGIDEEHIGRIFEPFFTTKKEGKGTGLGLSAVKRALEDHGGSVSVTSVDGEGTTMTLMLPTDDRTDISEKMEKNVVFGKGTILLVDDEEINRSTGKEILETLGYSVLLAENGAEAVEAYRGKGDSINLVIMDMVMPVMDGYEAFEKIKELNSRARILILTGYADHNKLEMLRGKGVEDILKKPFQIPELSQVLAKILS